MMDGQAEGLVDWIGLVGCLVSWMDWVWWMDGCIEWMVVSDPVADGFHVDRKET